jgi:hypothetical protein
LCVSFSLFEENIPTACLFFPQFNDRTEIVQHEDSITALPFAFAASFALTSTEKRDDERIGSALGWALFPYAWRCFCRS